MILSETHISVFPGVRIGSLGLFLQFVVSVLCSMLMERWVALLGARVVYISSGALLVLTTAVMTVSHSVITVIVMVAVTGYTLCVLHVLPYTLLCQYHSNKQVSLSRKHTLQHYYLLLILTVKCPGSSKHNSSQFSRYLTMAYISMLVLT